MRKWMTVARVVVSDYYVYLLNSMDRTVAIYGLCYGLLMLTLGVAMLKGEVFYAIRGTGSNDPVYAPFVVGTSLLALCLGIRVLIVKRET